MLIDCNTLTHFFFVLKMPPDRKGKRKVVERITKRKSFIFCRKKGIMRVEKR